MADELQGVTLSLNEEDIRSDCQAMGIRYTGLMAVARRLRAQNTATQIADVLYMMMLSKLKGLNPIDDNYSLIAKPDGGFGLTFNKSAALHVINNHPKCKKGAIARRFMITGKGERIDIEEHPERIPGSWKLSEIDWEMTAIFEIDAEAGGVLRGFAKYKACFAAGRDGNPKFLWLKDPLGMTMKQAEKDLANTKLDGSLPEALPAPEEEDGVIIALAVEPPRQLPQASETVVDAQATMSTTTQAEQPKQPTEDLTAIIAKGVQLGINEAQVVAAWREQQKAGMTLQQFEAEIDKQIAARAAKATKGTTRRVRKAPAADEAKLEAPKKEQKPRVTVSGTIDAIEERQKELPKKPGETEAKRQSYLIISMNNLDMYAWDSKWFDDMFLAMEAKPQKRVKITYTESATKDDPPKVFYTVEGFELMEDEESQVPMGEEGISLADKVAHEEALEDMQEAQTDEPEPPEDEPPKASGGFLF